MSLESDKGEGQQTTPGASASPSKLDNTKEKKKYVNQTDVPAYSLEQALRIAQSIGENYAFAPTRPLDVAAALNLSPGSGYFRMLCGCSSAYGLTEGGYNSPQIVVTALARRILEPTKEEDDIQARREAMLKPRVIKEFLNKYEGHKFPREDIAINVLIQMGVPRDAAQRTLELISESAKASGFFRDIKGTIYVNLQGTNVAANLFATETGSGEEDQGLNGRQGFPSREVPISPPREQQDTEPKPTPEKSGDNRRVFITHGKNKAFLDTLKDLLSFGELEPVISVERESVSQPVPDKVINDMRSCSAALIHVDAEQKLMNSDGEVQVVLNPNVLIEIGAAMALYGRRFILLVREGTALPSNLQGLYEVRYLDDKLDAETTIRLLKAIKEIKNHPMP